MFGQFKFQSDTELITHIAGGMDEAMVSFVRDRTPMPSSLSEGNESFSYFTINGEIGVASKTVSIPSSVFGAPDNCRTTVFHFTLQDLIPFDSNPALLAYFLASGGLFVEVGDPAAELNELSNLSSFVFDAESWLAEYDDTIVKQVDRAFDIHDQVFLACDTNPFKLVSGLYYKMDHHKRWDRSFTFGSVASDDHRFGLQLFRKFDVTTQCFLMEQQVRYFEIACYNQATG